MFLIGHGYAPVIKVTDGTGQVVFDQQRLIDRLTKELALLRSRTAGVEEGGTADVDERPPHY